MASIIETIRKTAWTVDEREFESLLAPGPAHAIKYFAAIFSLNAVLQVASIAVSTGNIPFSILAGAALAISYGIGTALVLPAVAHAFLWFFRSGRPFTDTLQMFLYGATPAMLLSWVPCLGAFAPMISFGNTFRGVREINKLGFLEAFLAVLLPALTYWGVWLLLGTTLMSLAK